MHTTRLGQDPDEPDMEWIALHNGDFSGSVMLRQLDRLMKEDSAVGIVQEFTVPFSILAGIVAKAVVNERMANEQTQARQVQAMRLLLEVIVDAAREAGSLGAPSGPLYAAVMSLGCTLEVYNQAVGALKKIGCIREEGYCLHFVADLPGRSAS